MSNLLTVSLLNTHIKTLLKSDPILRYVKVKGEISNFVEHGNGHYYFTLKDNKSSINAVVFNPNKYKVKDPIQNGDEVLISGYIDVYLVRGTYQLVVDEMELFGKGALLIELEALKQKLKDEGLFEESRKRKIPAFPKAIGIISAPSSAALEDMVKNIRRRYPICQIYFFPSLVQGTEAPKDLIRAFTLSQKYDLSTLIIGRGGGSSEDLHAFNDESLVRALVTSRAPLIAAIGHEVDFTLVDFISDQRVSTPTGAAEIATPDQKEIYETLNISLTRMNNALRQKVLFLKEKFALLKDRPFFLKPDTLYEVKLDELKEQKKRLHLAFENYFLSFKHELNVLKKTLHALSPFNVLQRGYAILENEEQKVISSVDDVSLYQDVVARVKDGIINLEVKKKEKKNNE
ncbi:MAG: exodeoxyribonuclease VII large subunit [Bacilli bacterium]|jgi:exodeoxyribonuclease VII large subunit|nr:exodeoxyribonuclease VII large subunit [Bacilli bacterium]NLN80482.1 exodeoxyribonuclease VII large subunit [Erysipelotrichia bacterium]